MDMKGTARGRLGLGLLILLAAAWFPCRAAADGLVLEDGKSVTGQITYEDDQKIEIQTENYGTLTFKKYHVKQVQRQFGGSSSASPAAPLTPAAPSSGGVANPFSGSAPALGTVVAPGAEPVGGATNPFGSSAPAGPSTAAPVAGTANPFAPSIPAGPAPAALAPTGPAPAAPAPGGPTVANPFAAGGPGTAPAGPGMQPGLPGVASTLAPGMGTTEATGSTGTVPPASEAAFSPAGPSEAGPEIAQADFVIPTLPSALETDEAPPIPAGYDGVMYGIEGESAVELKRVDQNNWLVAQDGSPLLVGDAVRTGDGKAKIRLRGRDSLRLPPRSHVVLVALSIDASQVTIEVRNGTVWTEVAPRARLSDFKVVTPDLTAGVRGTLFKTSVETGKGSRVAVLQNEVEVASNKTGESTMVPENKSVVVNPQGQMEPVKPVWPNEYDEWASWDEWKTETYNNLAVFSAVGAPIIQGLVTQAAEDNARHEAIMNEANRTITLNKYGEVLDAYAQAFMNFARDTGHVPDPETDGWTVLRENKGNWPGWNGPYLSETQLPPTDMWQRNVHYVLRYNRSGGNIHGVIYSEGLDRHDSKGQPGTDDITAYAMFYRLPNIASNPEYQGTGQGANAATP